MSPLRLLHRVFTVLALVAAVPVVAQMLPKPYASGPVSGRAVDAADGRPIEGAIVVARWAWLDYFPGGFERSPRFDDLGAALHVAEAVSDREGRFRFAGWGPVVRGQGKLVDDDAPELLVFKRGYEPLTVDVRSAGVLRLRRADATPAAQAAAIAAFQDGRPPSLAWRARNENWRAMPRMILALHREKARLGEDGAAILGAHLLEGRSGRGELVLDPEPQPSRWRPIIAIEWMLRRLDGQPGTMRAFQAKPVGIENSSSQFFVSPWRLPSIAPEGWEVDPDATPKVVIFAKDYGHSDELAWKEAGAKIRLTKLPPRREAVVDEVRALRAQVEKALGASPGEAAYPAIQPLLSLLKDECDALTPDLRMAECWESRNPAYAWLERNRANLSYATEFEAGVRTPRVASTGRPAIATGSASPIAAVQARPSGPALMAPGQRVPVGGFTIEPAR